MTDRTSETGFASRLPAGQILAVALRYRLPLALTGLVLVGVLLPTIVASTPLLAWGVSKASDGTGYEVSVGSASLGWFSPVVLHDVKVVDLKGEPVADLPSVRISKSLLGLLQDQTQLGTIELDKPVLHAQVGTLLDFPEATAEEQAAASDTSSSTQTRFHVVCRDGTFHLKDDERTWTFEALSAELDTNDPNQWIYTASATVRQGHQVGAVDLDGSLAATELPSRTKIQLQSIPLAIVDLFAEHYGYVVQTEGQLTGEAELQSERGVSSLKCDLQGGSVGLRLPESSRPGGWRNGTIRASGEIMLASDVILADQFSVTTDWGQLIANGKIPAGSLHTGLSESSVVDLLGPNPWELRGTLDLARLANAFPDLLHVRRGMELNEGRLTLNVASDSQAGQPSLRMVVLVSDVGADFGGRREVWQQPLELAANVSQLHGELRLDEIRCVSSFLTANGRTAGPQTNVQFKLDSNRLAADLARFVDFGSLQIAGIVEGGLQIQQLDSGQIAINASAQGTDVEASFGSQELVSQRQLGGQLQASLRFQDHLLQSIDSASAVVSTPQNTIQIQAAAPWDLGSDESIWSVKLQAQGSISNLWEQIRGFTPLQDFELAGQGSILARAAMGKTSWVIEGLNADINQFALTGPSTLISEPMLRLESAGSVDWNQQLIQVPEFTLVGTSISARGSEMQVPLAAGRTTSGSVAYRVDLAKGVHWVIPPQWLGETEVAGEMAGKLSVSSDEKLLTILNTGHVKNWQLRVPVHSNPSGAMVPVAQAAPSAIWAEPSLAYSQSVDINWPRDRLDMHQFQIQSSALELSSSGSITKLGSFANTTLEGEASYDWDRLADLLKPWLGPQLAIVGKQTSRFQFQGPLYPADSVSSSQLTVSPAWAAEGDVSWQRADLWGLPVGETILQGRLSQGLLSVGAQSPELSGGQLSIQAQMALNEGPAAWQIAPGRAIDNVAITPQMCRDWLLYVMPIVADATRVEGKFSADLKRGIFPVENPIGGQAEGVITIHGAQVRSGPLAQGYVNLARTIEAAVNAKPLSAIDQGSATLLTLPPQQVPFRVVQNRVYHQGLTVQSGEVQVVTSGWVGADETLQLVATIPIQDNWAARAPWLQPLRGTALTVPISGTLRQPKLDNNVLEQLSRDTIDRAARGAIEKGINRGLQELFRPR